MNVIQSDNEEVVSTPGRMPTVAFGDNADYGTLRSVVNEWCVAVTITDGSQVLMRVDASLDDPDPDRDSLTGWSFVEDWEGPIVSVYFDEITSVVVI
jgi:hypothetical protein